MAWYIEKSELADRLLAKSEFDRETGCWNWTAAKSYGYGAIRINGKTRPAHCVSFEVDNGPIPPGMHVCHRCDNPACIRPDHLFLGLPKDNMADKVAKGRQCRLRGVESGRAKLTETEVLEIRAIRGATLRGIAKEYGISHVQVLKIRSGESWAHLTQGGS